MYLENYQTLSPKRRRVCLHGALGEQFGKEYQLAVRSPVEAIRLLCANFRKEFENAIKSGDWQVIIGDPEGKHIQCSLEFCKFQIPNGDIHFIPVPRGAGGGTRGKGVFLAILGVALIATSLIGALGVGAGLSAGLGTSAFTIGGTAITWGQIGLLGLALTLAGVSALLTPQAQVTPTQYPSFFYSGSVNTEKEGGIVPLVYGRFLCGSTVIHAGVSNNLYAPTDVILPTTAFHDP